MNTFIHDDFLLHTQTAKTLFHEHAEKMPIIDFHNHLNPQEIYEDRCYDNLTQVWLLGDHYKWRAMRADGVPERLITGDADPRDRFHAWASTVQHAFGNPLYHWTHLELARYFGVTQTLSPATADEIYDTCSSLLQTKDYSVRNLLRMQHVETLCTTDDPADDLKWHRLLKQDGFEIQVLPTFRPERALGIEKNDFPGYIRLLESVVGNELTGITALLQALYTRLDYFVENGCRITDHSLECAFYVPATQEQADLVYRKRLSGHTLSEEECAMYRGFLLTALGRAYAKRHLVMQLHIGALRDNASRMFRMLGANTGFDSLQDFNYAPQLSSLLDSMDASDELPRTILYYLNPKDADMLAAMAGNFQSNDEGIRGKVQLGAAWWFCDHKDGMMRQMDALSDAGMFSTFIGMLTDSRSFLSYPRHEYFRRILCDRIGSIVECGEYPKSDTYLGQMTEDICYRNAHTFLNL
jgi:glucuronate isomerase